MAWWDWPQWERMIDWMALHGINMPLAVTGQEAVWQKLCRKLGLSDDEIGRVLRRSGLSAVRLDGLHRRLGRPLAAVWIDRTPRAGAGRSSRRERELGMTPVLQGFTGHVPAALEEQVPAGAVPPASELVRVSRNVVPRPARPACSGGSARRLSRSRPGSSAPTTSTRRTRSSRCRRPAATRRSWPTWAGGCGAMRDADPEAVWVMQGWLFVNNPGFWKPPQGRALLTSVPDDQLIAARPHVRVRPRLEEDGGLLRQAVGLLHHPDLRRHGQPARRPAADRRQPAGGHDQPARPALRGIGHIMEGLGCNPVVHDFLADMTWHSEVPERRCLAARLRHRRYGQVHPRPRGLDTPVRSTSTPRRGQPTR